MLRPNIDASVIICAYQQPATVRLILDCLLDQTSDARIEIIVCDDGSKADFFSACRDFIQAAPVPVYWVWQKDVGYTQASNINNGIRIANGRYLIFLDGDMIPEQDLVARHLEAHLTPGRIVVGERAWRDLTALEARSPLSPAEAWKLLRGQDALSPSSKAWEWLEKKIQKRRLGSPEPWHAGFLCNLSVERSPSVYLDEFFEGWGFDDTEFVRRLVAVEGLTVHHAESATAYHLANLISNPWTTRSHDDIVKYLRNLCYFLDKWPDSFGDYPMSLLPFELDDETNTWTITPVSLKAPKRDFATFAGQVRIWMEANGHFPLPS